LLDKELENKVKTLLISIVQDKKPETIRQLIYLVKKEVNVPEADILWVIQNLKEEKKFEFIELLFPESPVNYILSRNALWFWTTVIISVLSVLAIFLIPESAFPQTYLRNFLGIVFVTYLPGYTLIKTLYPISVPLKTRSLTLDSIERIALSLALSLSLTPMIGLILYYTPAGLNISIIVLCLLGVTFIFAASGVLCEYKAKKSLFVRKIVPVTDFEFSESILRFFDVKGFKKRLVVVKEIPLAEITTVDVRGDELTVTSNGTATIFFLRRNNKSFIDLYEKLTSLLNFKE